MIGFDLETYPIGPKRSPKVIVGAMNILKTEAKLFNVKQWSTLVKELPNSDREIYFFWADKLDLFVSLCEQCEGPVVAHNGAYDWSCISAMNPEYIGRIYKMFRNRKLECTYIRTLVALNSQGELKTTASRKYQLEHGKYGATSLVGTCHSFCNLDLSEVKDHDIQVTYYKVENIRNVFDWPKAYREYLIQDVEYLPSLFYAQANEKVSKVIIRQSKKVVNIFDEAPRRACFHYALTLASAWGMQVDPMRVAKLRNDAESEVQEVAELMVATGFAVELEGKARERAVQRGKLAVKLVNDKVRQAVKEGYESQNKEVPVTKKGTISVSRSHLIESGHTVLQKWAKVGDKRTIWSTFIPALEKSFSNNGVVNTQFFPYSETGRVSARNPNLLNPPRSGGIRECIKAREGACFVFCDYEANELRVLSQVLLDQLNTSRLAELYIEDPYFDPHTYMACRKLKIDYEEGKKRKAAGDKKFKEMRQLMKCCNFGFPGGMASRTFIEFAKGYNVKVTEEEAENLKSFFFSQFPEVKYYLDRVGRVVRTYDGQGYLERAERLSSNRRFCQLANFYFQGLAAEGGLVAFARVSEYCYSDPSSKLYGCRPVLFVHDEIILEAPLEKAHDAAMELKHIMETSMTHFTPDIPSVAEPTLAFKWWKGAYQRFDGNGKLIPSDLE